MRRLMGKIHNLVAQNLAVASNDVQRTQIPKGALQHGRDERVAQLPVNREWCVPSRRAQALTRW